MINEEKRKIQLEAFEALKANNFNGTVILPTGVGKTWILIECLKHLQEDVYTIFYGCDNRKLRDVDFPKQLQEWDGERFFPIMERYCYQTAYKLEGFEYDIGLFDEADYSLTPRYMEVYKNNTFKHKILVSATLEDEKRAAVNKIAPIVYEKKMSEINGQGIVNNAQLHLVKYMLNSTENRKYLAFNEVFKRMLNLPNRNNQALDAVKRNRKLFLGSLHSSEIVCKKLMKKLYLENENNKILIFCTTAEQADNVCKFSYHSKNAKDNEYLQMFDDGDIRVISVVGKIDRGVNLKGVNVIVFEAPAQSKTKLTQKSGRGRRLEIDQILYIFFLIPFYKDRMGKIKPTVVQKWVENSTKDLGLPFKIYKL